MFISWSDANNGLRGTGDFQDVLYINGFNNSLVESKTIVEGTDSPACSFNVLETNSPPGVPDDIKTYHINNSFGFFGIDPTVILEDDTYTPFDVVGEDSVKQVISDLNISGIDTSDLALREIVDSDDSNNLV